MAIVRTHGADGDAVSAPAATSTRRKNNTHEDEEERAGDEDEEEDGDTHPHTRLSQGKQEKQEEQNGRERVVLLMHETRVLNASDATRVLLLLAREVG